jgi:hypothetical protein
MSSILHFLTTPKEHTYPRPQVIMIIDDQVSLDIIFDIATYLLSCHYIVLHE